MFPGGEYVDSGRLGCEAVSTCTLHATTNEALFLKPEVV